MFAYKAALFLATAQWSRNFSREHQIKCSAVKVLSCGVFEKQVGNSRAVSSVHERNARVLFLNPDGQGGVAARGEPLSQREIIIASRGNSRLSAASAWP